MEELLRLVEGERPCWGAMAAAAAVAAAAVALMRAAAIPAARDRSSAGLAGRSNATHTSLQDALLEKDRGEGGEHDAPEVGSGGDKKERRKREDEKRSQHEIRRDQQTRSLSTSTTTARQQPARTGLVGVSWSTGGEVSRCWGAERIVHVHVGEAAKQAVFVARYQMVPEGSPHLTMEDQPWMPSAFRWFRPRGGALAHLLSLAVLYVCPPDLSPRHSVFYLVLWLTLVRL